MGDGHLHLGSQPIPIFRMVCLISVTHVPNVSVVGLTNSVLRLATSELGGPSAGVYFVDHGDYAAQVMENLGETIVDEDYPNDHTHTAPDLVSITTCLIATLLLKYEY